METNLAVNAVRPAPYCRNPITAAGSRHQGQERTLKKNKKHSKAKGMGKKGKKGQAKKERGGSPGERGL